MQTTETPAGGAVTNAGVEGENKTSKALLVLAVGIGYAMGSLPLGSIGGTVWMDIAIFEEWVREVVVPLYTLSVLVYLPVRFLFYGQAKEANSEDGSRPLLSSLRSSFSLPPVLRKLSTTTIPEEVASDSQTSLLDQQQQNDGETEEADKPIDMTGVFKVVKNHNFDGFLKAQGLPGFLCKAAARARPTHNFTHASYSKLTIKIRGIIDSETFYQIDGPCTETAIRGRTFQDAVTYLYEGGTGNSSGDEPAEEGPSSNDEMVCAGIKTRKVAVGMGYVIHVERRIVRAGSTWVPTPETNPDGHFTYDLDTPCGFDRLIMTNKIVYEDSGKEPIIASQLFHQTN